MVEDECVVDDVNSAGVDSAVQNRLMHRSLHRFWEVVDSAVFDIAVQSRSWHRL